MWNQFCNWFLDCWYFFWAQQQYVSHVEVLQSCTPPPTSMDGILKSVIITSFPSHYNFLSYPIWNLAKKIILNYENKIATTRKFRAHEQTIIISSDCFFVIVYFYFVTRTGWQVVNEHRNEKLYRKGFLLQCVYILLLYQDTFLRLTPHID